MALPIAGEAFVCITYTVACRDGVERWRSCGVRTLDEADRTMARLTRQPNTRNIYVCMSSQREATAKIVGADGFTIHDVHRSAYGAFALKSLFIDVDVKPGAYATTAEAADALKAFLRATTLPPPTLLVGSGGGGFHAHWVLDRALGVDEWRPLAVALAQAAKHHGFVIDPGVSTDAARVLRVPGTKNFKYDPPRDVLLVSAIVGNDYPVEWLAAKLAPYVVTASVSSRGSANSQNAELSGGIAAANFCMEDFAGASRHVAALAPSPWGLSADGGDGYDGWKVFVMACAYIITVVGHSDAVLALYDEIVLVLGRDAAANLRRLKDACASTLRKDQRGDAIIGPGSVFRLAMDHGWKPPAAGATATTFVPNPILNIVQEAELAELKDGLRAAYDNGKRIERDRSRGDAVHFIRKRVRTGLDPLIAGRLVFTLAWLLARDGWGAAEITDAAVICAQQHDEAQMLAKWAITKVAEGVAA